MTSPHMTSSPAELLTVLLTGGGITALVSYLKDRRRDRRAANRDDALLPLDLIEKATAIAGEQLDDVRAELVRLRGRLAEADDENDRLRRALGAVRTELEQANRRLANAEALLAAVRPRRIPESRRGDEGHDRTP